MRSQVGANVDHWLQFNLCTVDAEFIDKQVEALLNE